MTLAGVGGGHTPSLAFKSKDGAAPASPLAEIGLAVEVRPSARTPTSGFRFGGRNRSSRPSGEPYPSAKVIETVDDRFNRTKGPLHELAR
jgi:hypothetical protein